MSIIGTGIAAAVANTANQAQQSGRAANARSAAQSERSAQSDKLIISQLHGTGATRDTDQDMPDPQAPGYEDLYGEGDGEAQQHPGDEQEHAEEKSREDSESQTAQDKIHLADAPVTSPTGLPITIPYRTKQGLESRSPLFHELDVQG